MRILAGVDRPTRGTVRVLGRAPTDREGRARGAYLPDASPFPEERSAPAVRDLVGALGGLRRRARRERAAALLERVGLADARRAPLRTFSRGMHRRFGFAHAYLTDPEGVRLDEPTAVRLEQLVHAMATKRLMDGQFDECGLTLQELQRVGASLIKSLTAVYHGRVKYPGQETA